MTLRYMDQAEAERRCGGTLESWIKGSGYKGCHSAEETRAAVDDAKRWAKASNTARDLMIFVESARQEILVVGMKGGYQCFDSTGTDEIQKVPVIYIDVEGQLNRFVRGAHELHFAPQDCAGKNVRLETMDNRVALLHEFGHGKQWIENPLMFDNYFKEAKGKTTPGKLNVTRRGMADPLLHPQGKPEQVTVGVQGRGNAGESFAQSIQRRATEVWGDKGRQAYDPLLHPDAGRSISSDDNGGAWLLTAEELEANTPIKGYSVRIEADNMARHEWPICDELGIARRLNYRDIGGTTNPRASLTTTLLQRQAQKTEQPAWKAMSKTKSQCPTCGKMVTERGMKSACGTLLHA